MEVLDQVIADEDLAEFMRNQMSKRAEEVAAKAKEAFEDRFYSVDDEWGEVEMAVKNIKLAGEPEVIEAQPGSATIEMHFATTFKAHLSYDDSSTGVYDSETISQLFMEHVEETTPKEEEFDVEVNVSFDADLDPTNLTIEEVNLVYPDDSYSVPSSKWEGDTWK